MILKLEHVNKIYKTDDASVPALQDVSLEVERGKFVALVGRSGCGKSTLLNLIAGMDLPSSGTVTLDGLVTSTLNDDGITRMRREKVGFIFQSFQLLPTLSVIENVELPLLLARKPSARAAAIECLRWVDMSSYAARMPYQLSGGQMQRVAIARALIHSPAVLLADEPTGNLDTATGDAILALLKRLSVEKNTTIVMATHSLEAAGITDTIVRLRDGHIEEIRELAESR